MNQKRINQFPLICWKHIKNGRVKVVGNSMYPCIQEGDIARLAEYESYNQGDIIVFNYGENIIIHRIIAKYDNFLLCKGDNSFAIEKIKKEQVLGKIIKVQRKGIFVDLPDTDKEFIKLSIAINRIFCVLNNSVTKTIETPEYQYFSKKYLNRE